MSDAEIEQLHEQIEQLERENSRLKHDRIILMEFFNQAYYAANLKKAELDEIERLRQKLDDKRKEKA